MSDLTIVAIGIAVLMLAFLFVDATSGSRPNKTVVTVELAVFVIAGTVAVISYIMGGM